MAARDTFDKMKGWAEDHKRWLVGGAIATVVLVGVVVLVIVLSHKGADKSHSHSHSQPPASHSKPPPSHSKPPPSHSKPPPSHSKPPPSHSKPPPSHSTPVLKVKMVLSVSGDLQKYGKTIAQPTLSHLVLSEDDRTIFHVGTNYSKWATLLLKPVQSTVSADAIQVNKTHVHILSQSAKYALAWRNGQLVWTDNLASATNFQLDAFPLSIIPTPLKLSSSTPQGFALLVPSEQKYLGMFKGVPNLGGPARRAYFIAA